MTSRPLSFAQRYASVSMRAWHPGLPVQSAQDHEEWQEWRKQRKRQQQRERRARNPRIDYYPNVEAAAIVYALVGPVPGRDLSSLLNRIVTEWSATGIKKRKELDLFERKAPRDPHADCPATPYRGQASPSDRGPSSGPAVRERRKSPTLGEASRAGKGPDWAGGP